MSEANLPQVLPASLRRRWWAAAALAVLALGGGYLWIRAALGVEPAARWLLPAGAGMALVLWQTWRGLPANHLPGRALLPGLGPANWVTILRAMLLAVLAGFLALPRPTADLAWAPAILYTIAIAADLLDGALARLTGRVTALGAQLDMAADGFGMLVAVALAVQYGQLPWPYLLVGLARYLFVAGLWWLRRRGCPTYELPASTFRRIAAGLQMAFISVILWPLFGPPATYLAGACFAIPLLAGFVRDWLVVSGTLNPDSTSYRRVASWYAFLAHRLPFALRLAGAGLAMTLVGSALDGGIQSGLLGKSAQPALYLALGAEGRALAAAVAMLAIASAGLVTLGVVSRLSALALLAATCADLAMVGYRPYHAGLLVVVIGVLYLGNGAYALWPADDALFERRPRRVRPAASGRMTI